MRIIINGPKKIDRFPSVNYAKLQIKALNFRTDKPMRHRKRQNVETADDEEDHSETGKNCMIIKIIIKIWSNREQTFRRGHFFT